MLPLRIGVQLKSLRLPLRRALAVAGELGVEAVEIDARGEIRSRDMSQTAVRQLRKQLDDHGLRVAALEYRTRRGYHVRDDLEARVEGTKEAMRLAYRLGAAVVINHVGRVPQAESSDWSLLVDVLGDLSRFGQRTGARLAATAAGAESGEDLARVLAAIPEGGIAVNLDPGELVRGGGSPLEVIEKVGTSIAHVRANDGVRDLSSGMGLAVPLGRGSVDYPAILAALEQRDYRGYLTIERQGPEDPREEISHAVSYLRNLAE